MASSIAGSARNMLRSVAAARNMARIMPVQTSSRALHVSSSFSNQVGRTTLDRRVGDSFEEEPEEHDEEDEDLFSVSDSTPVPPAAETASSRVLKSKGGTIGPKAAAKAATKQAKAESRQEWVAFLNSLLTMEDRKEATGLQMTMRKGMLKWIVRNTATADEAEELKTIFQTWRMLKLRVTDQVQLELVGRCCSVGRPDIPLELDADPIRYGLPGLTPRSQFHLYQNLKTVRHPTPISPPRPGITMTPVVAIVRLSALLHQDKLAAFAIGKIHPQDQGKPPKLRYAQVDASAEHVKHIYNNAGKDMRMWEIKLTDKEKEYVLDCEMHLVRAGGYWEKALNKIKKFQRDVQPLDSEAPQKDSPESGE